MDDLPSEVWCTFAGVINEVTQHQIMYNFCGAIARNVQTIHFLIQSPGGRVADGVALYNYLVALPITLITYNAGAVQSAAVLPFLAGKHRIASDTAIFMIHKAGTTIPERVPAWFLRQRADDLEIDDRNSERILKKYIVMPEEKWEKYQSIDLFIAAHEALQFSFVHDLSAFKPPADGAMFHIT